jgi:hypothetical protein
MMASGLDFSPGIHYCFRNLECGGNGPDFLLSTDLHSTLL